MQHLPREHLREALSIIKSGQEIDKPTAIHLKKQLAEEFREQLMLGTPTNQDETGLRRLAAQIKAKKVAESKVILLSATPYNKTYGDLGNQLRLFIPDDKDIGIRPEKLLSLS
jgi:hypothetical protein